MSIRNAENLIVHLDCETLSVFNRIVEVIEKKDSKQRDSMSLKLAYHLGYEDALAGRRCNANQVVDK